MNDVSEELADYLKEMNEAAIAADKECDEKPVTMERVPQPTRLEMHQQSQDLNK
jgi:hypothetical protein